MAEQKKVLSYRKKHKFKKIYILFLLVVAYLIIQLILFAMRDQIYLYEVQTAINYSTGTTHTGVIVREEQDYFSSDSGIINYYISNGKKMGKNDIVYTVDANGEFAQQLELQRLDVELLSKESLIKIKKNLESISSGYCSEDFQDIYEQKAYLKAMILDAVNEEAMKKLDADMMVGFKTVQAAESGFLSLTTDTYDGLTQEAITSEVFDEENFSINHISSGTAVKSGDFAYRLIKNEYFDLIFPMSSENLAQYSNLSSMSVYLKNIDVQVTGDFTIFTGSDGGTYGEISFNRYGSQVCNQRFLEFEILSADVTGYKIPVSAVTQKRCLKVPEEYCFTENGDTYVWGNKQGTENAIYEKIKIDILGNEKVEEQTYNYVFSENLEAGDKVYYVEDGATTTSYQLSDYIQLDGVYSANRGYAIFKRVDILAQTRDSNYYIVRQKYSYSISAYDFIVLNANEVSDGTLLY